MILVLPLCNKDATLAYKNLQWIHELDGKLNHPCIVSYEDGTDPAKVSAMLALASETFIDVKDFHYPEATSKNWPAGANWAWQNVARYIPMVYTKEEPWLFLEADATPLKKGWLDTLEQEYRKGGKPFMGHIVQDMGHMNGVAIYPNHVSWFARKPFLVEQSAWDVSLMEETIELTHNANHLIQHCWGLASNDMPQHRGDDPVASFRDTGHMLRVVDPNAVLFHRCKDGSLIDCLSQMNQPNWKPESTKPIITVPVKEEEPLPPQPKTEIFIVTYSKDSEWLKHCLRSIRKFARGFSGVTVAAPSRDLNVIQPVCCDNLPASSLKTFDEVEGKGMLHHMAIKCMADEFCPEAEYILHTDSDCIFIEPVTPADYFVDGKPVLLKEHFDRFRDKHPGILKWKACAEDALGFSVSHETMRRHPAVHPKWLYYLVRQRVEKVHNRPFLDYVLSKQNEYPQGFTEFPTLGGFALAMYPTRYHWIDTGEVLPPKDKLAQFWSHGGLDRPTDTGAWPGETPRSIIKRILGE